MADYRRSSSFIGRERALEHIRQAKALSVELGGTDNDVKKYFFSLSKRDLDNILREYEQKYGAAAREYAEKTLGRWKSGRVHMSGMVAERLFGLLPAHMPLQTKYKLTESLWKHVGPCSKKTYYVGLDADLDQVAAAVRHHIEEVVVQYKIPESMEKRFDWLSQGDVSVKQDLLNHFRQHERQLAAESLQLKLPILVEYLRGASGGVTHHAAHVLTVGKHEVKVIIDRGVSGINETAPRRYLASWNQGDFSWIWWIIGIAILLWVLSD